MNQHDYARFEHKKKTIDNSVRLFWIPISFKEYDINVGIQLKNREDIENLAQLAQLDLSKTVDNYQQTVLESNLVELITVSDLLYNYVADYYRSHDIHVDVTNLNQPVLSTIYNFNQSL